ncbi:hypothetical protein, partial [Hyalangium versicolor]|uniref:hypothetical protein n=1 Tax=Hyalangium versicolor TaxID=2861190 RepID=UPI001CCFD884
RSDPLPERIRYEVLSHEAQVLMARFSGYPPFQTLLLLGALKRGHPVLRRAPRSLELLPIMPKDSNSHGTQDALTGFTEPSVYDKAEFVPWSSIDMSVFQELRQSTARLVELIAQSLGLEDDALMALGGASP